MFHFSNLYHILNILKKKIIVIANLLSKLQAVNVSLRPFRKKCSVRTPFDTQHVKESEKRLQSARENFYHIFSSLCKKLIWKISPSVIRQILGVFRNTLTANDKHPLWDCENFHIPIQNEKVSSIFVLFLEFTSNLENFEKEDGLHSCCISEITDCERLA